MAKRNAPHFLADSLLDISPKWLTDAGVEIVFIDLDNTMSPYGVNAPTPELRLWIDAVKAAGVEPFILSNNSGERPKVFALELDIGYAGRAVKPFTRVLRSVLAEKNCSAKSAALVGDQVFTDLFCARRAGVLSVTVKPLSLKNPILVLRYGIETPFRAYYRFKGKRVERV